MAKGSVYEGKSYEEAVRKGLDELRLSRSEATITLVEEGKGGFLGLGARPFRVSIMRRPGGPVREPEETRERRVSSRERDGRRGRGGRDRERPREGGRDGGKDRGREGGREGGREAGRPQGPPQPQPARAEGRREERRSERREERRPGPRDERGARPQAPASPAPRPAGDAAMAGAAPPSGRAESSEHPGDEDGRRRRRRGRRGGRGRRRMGEGGALPEEGAPRVNGDTHAHAHEGEHEHGENEPGDFAFEPMPVSAEPVSSSGERLPAMAPAPPPIPPAGARAPRPAVAPMPVRAREEAPVARVRERESHAEHHGEPSMSDAELAETSKRLTEDLLRGMGFQATVTVAAEGNRSEVTAEVTEGDELLTGQKGEVRQAMQHLLNRFLNRGEGSRYHLQLEINDFWKRREAELETLARSLADEALAKNAEVVTEYLNSQERRIIHVTLREDTRVRTYALGTGMIKRVAVAPASFPERTGEEDAG